MKSRRITFFGNFGAGNLGNECTLQAIIEQTLKRWPQATLQCVCTVPEDAELRHNIRAFHFETMKTRATGRVADRDQESPLPAASSWAPAPSPPPPLDSKQAVIVGGRRGPTALLAKFLRIALFRIPREFAHWATGLRILKRSDMLIVSGTGIVSDYLCGPFGWPYDLFKWSALAALCRVRVLFLSIGVGPIYHPISRWLIKRSLGFADYRSYRDEASKQYLERIGFSTDRDAVCPDLAFGLSRRLFPSDSVRAGQRPVIGVGLKDYHAASEGVGANTYRNYVNIMAAFVCWLCEHDYSVRLLIGDVRYDTQVRQDVIDVLKGRSFAAEQGQVLAEPALTVEELLRQLGETDAVISPRFHNLVLALMLNKPAIALSDHPKLDSLMAGLGLADYCLPLANLDADSLIKLFRQLENDAERLKPYIRGKVEKYREALDEQYASAFAGANAPALGQ